MSTGPCVRGCTLRGRHRDDCPDQDVCGGCLPRPAQIGRLCEVCYDRAGRALEGMADVWHKLQNRLQMSAQLVMGRVSGTPNPLLLVDPAVVEHRDLMARVLTSWSMMVAEERGINPPSKPRVWVTSEYLNRNLRWAAEQHWAGDLVREVLDLSGRGHSLLYPSGRRTMHLGQCPVVNTSGGRCEGHLSVSVARTDDLLPDDITCSEDSEHTWAPGRGWLRLGLLIHGSWEGRGA